VETKPVAEPKPLVAATEVPPASKTKSTEVPQLPTTEVTTPSPDPAPVEPVEEEPFEVVQLDAESITVSRDIPVPQETPSEPPVAADTSSQPNLPVAASPVTTTPPPAEPPGPEKKRGFFQRINPVNLFRGDDEEKAARSEEIITPLPPSGSPPSDRTPSPTSGPRTVADAGEYSNLTPMRANTGPRRYSYSTSGTPKPGDRAASERLFQRGLDAQSQLDPGRAASYFASAAMADPSYFPAQYNLGLLSYQTGQTMKSLSAFETALALDPNSAEARYNFALALQKSRYPLDAVNELNKLLASSPENLRAHLLLGNVYAQDLDDIDRARIQYGKVLELDSDHPQAPAIRAWMNEHP
jgi:Tfp pilus assembly protein PilF